MTIAYRLTMMFVSLAIIALIGWWGTGTFQFVVSQFWFISGALLLILLSLVDQPHFSRDANVLVTALQLGYHCFPYKWHSAPAFGGYFSHGLPTS